MSQPIVTAPSAGVSPGPHDRPSPAALRRAAEDFEAVFLAQMLTSLTQGLGGDGVFFGGGEGDPFRSMLHDEVAKLISRSGGIGLADAVLQEMIKMQEIA